METGGSFGGRLWQRTSLRSEGSDLIMSKDCLRRWFVAMEDGVV
jgi:hypothetical protein